MIRKALVLQGHSMAWLAKKLGISRMAVSQWEAKKHRPSPKHLMEISKLLDIPMEKLYNHYYTKKRG